MGKSFRNFKILKKILYMGVYAPSIVKYREKSKKIQPQNENRRQFDIL